MAADEGAVARLLASRVEQGLPPRVEDLAVIEQIAAILRRADEHSVPTGDASPRGER